MRGRFSEYKEGQTIGMCAYLYDVDPYVNPKGSNVRKAMFRCRCGNEFSAVINSVKNMSTKSCGCVRIKMYNKKCRKHGMCGTPIYIKWGDIKSRCYNKKNKSYKWYGLLGIHICDEWINDPKAFIDHMMELPHALEDGYSIDRFPKTDGNYEPGNVRWATGHEQAVNQGNNTNNTSGYKGVSYNKAAKKWAAYIGVNGVVISLGLFKTIKEAIEVRNTYIIEHGLTEYKIQPYKGP